MAKKRTLNTERDPQTESGLEFEEPTSKLEEGMHETEEDQRLDSAHRNADATVRTQQMAVPLSQPDVQDPDQQAEALLSRATQGGGSLDEDDDAGVGFEERIDRDALAAGIVPQMISQASLEEGDVEMIAARELDGDYEEDEFDLEPTISQARVQPHAAAR
jgi:hypothetical protein